MSTLNYPVFGTIFAPGGTATSGVALNEREIQHHPSGSGILFGDYLKHASGLTPEHIVTRKMGLSTSISTRQDVGPSGMASVQERKVFFLPSDRGKSEGFADWTIFTAAGDPTTATDGVTDTDITPNATFDGGS